MPDLKQALKDLVATSNSGKYTDEATLLSKFPELKEYDVNSLRDFVATSNSGKYESDDELFSKFPEFNIVGARPELKKKGSQVTCKLRYIHLYPRSPFGIFKFILSCFHSPALSILLEVGELVYVLDGKLKQLIIRAAVRKTWNPF